MPAQLRVLVLSGILVSGLLAVGGSRGLTQAVEVVVLVDPFSTEPGATVHVTAYVFDRGAPAEPSEISAFIDELPGITPLALVRQSLGVFEGVFVFDSHPSLVVVNATVGSTQDSETAVVYRSYDRVRVVPSTGMARPGETIAVTVETQVGDGPLEDVDSLELTAEAVYPPGFERRSLPTVLNWTRTAVGRYSAAYAVPADIDRDALIVLWATVARGSSGAGVGASVYVDFPDPFLVWYRTLALGGPNATLEIGVASPAGAPMSNATVSFRTWPFPGAETVSEGTTDPSGAARFDIPVASIPSAFHGNATFGSQRQPFQGFLTVPDLPVPEEPELIRENPGEVFEVGETAVLRFRLSRGDNPIANQELFVYAHTLTDVILAERVRTDLTGRFEVRFVAPAGSMRFDIGGAVEGTWEAFRHGFTAVNRLDAIVSSSDGWHLVVSGRFPSEPGPWVAHVGLSTKEGPLPGPWIATGSFDAHRIIGGSEGAPFALDISLPRFLAAGQSVSLSIWAASLRGEGEGIGLHEFHLTVVAGTPIPRPSDMGVLVILLGFGILIAMSAFGWRRGRLPRKKRENGETPSPRRP